MNTFRRQALLNVFRLFDVAVMVFSCAVATVVIHLSGPVPLERLLSMRVRIGNFVLFASLLLLWHMILSGFGLYRSRRFSALESEIIDVIKATSVGTLAVLLASVLFRIRLITPGFVAIFLLVSSLTIVSSRVVLRYSLRRIRLHGRNLRNMVLVGTNPRAVEFARKVAARPDLGYQIVGFVDDDWTGTVDFHKTGFRLICGLDGFRGYLRRSVVDEVVMSLPVRSYYSQSLDLAAVCEEQGVVLRHLAFNPKAALSHAEEFEGDLLIRNSADALQGWPLVVKRALDFSMALAAVILLSPLLVLTAIVVKLTSPGPVFFVQDRLGLSKRKFRIYKFRTMVADAEKRLREIEHLNEVSGPVFKIKNDPRLTPIGGLLRKASIDELPQLFNVLKGEMSLVGPRPLPVRDFEGFSEDWHRRRFSVLPGLTCLWQIDGRSGIPFETWMALDLQYVDKWSLWLDCKILLRTIPAVLRGSGAA
jgi:exopolysaccharide biosynthesis polyprenyl glycosylphosphotransferase